MKIIEFINERFFMSTNICSYFPFKIYLQSTYLNRFRLTCVFIFWSFKRCPCRLSSGKCPQTYSHCGWWPSSRAGKDFCNQATWKKCVMMSCPFILRGDVKNVKNQCFELHFTHFLHFFYFFSNFFLSVPFFFRLFAHRIHPSGEIAHLYRLYYRNNIL